MKLTVFIFMTLFLLSGCGGMARTPDPVDTYQYGDESKTCEQLRTDLDTALLSLVDLKKRRKTKIAANLMLTGTGLLLFPPLLLGLDLSDTDKIEINAQRKRYALLGKIATDKGCGFKIEALGLDTVKVAHESPNDR